MKKAELKTTKYFNSDDDSYSGHSGVYLQIKEYILIEKALAAIGVAELPSAEKSCVDSKYSPKKKNYSVIEIRMLAVLKCDQNYNMLPPMTKIICFEESSGPATALALSGEKTREN